MTTFSNFFFGLDKIWHKMSRETYFLFVSFVKFSTVKATLYLRHKKIFICNFQIYFSKCAKFGTRNLQIKLLEFTGFIKVGGRKIILLSVLIKLLLCVYRKTLWYFESKGRLAYHAIEHNSNNPPEWYIMWYIYCDLNC